MQKALRRFLYRRIIWTPQNITFGNFASGSLRAPSENPNFVPRKFFFKHVIKKKNLAPLKKYFPLQYLKPSYGTKAGVYPAWDTRGRRVFWDERNFFKLSPIVLNYVQHNFQGGGEAPMRPPGFGPGLKLDARCCFSTRIALASTILIVVHKTFWDCRPNMFHPRMKTCDIPSQTCPPSLLTFRELKSDEKLISRIKAYSWWAITYMVDHPEHCIHREHNAQLQQLWCFNYRTEWTSSSLFPCLKTDMATEPDPESILADSALFRNRILCQNQTFWEIEPGSEVTFYFRQ